MMLDLNYFKSHIHEELEDAKAYMDKAIESKLSNPVWTSKFEMLSDSEISHATQLLRMMEWCAKDMDQTPTKNTKTAGDTATTISPITVYSDTVKEYGEAMTYITNLKKGLL